MPLASYSLFQNSMYALFIQQARVSELTLADNIKGKLGCTLWTDFLYEEEDIIHALHRSDSKGVCWICWISLLESASYRSKFKHVCEQYQHNRQTCLQFLAEEPIYLLKLRLLSWVDASQSWLVRKETYLGFICHYCADMHVSESALCDGGKKIARLTILCTPPQ